MKTKIMKNHFYSPVRIQKPDPKPTGLDTDIDTGSSTHALDGSQYLGIIEEQTYSEQPPTPEEQKPWRIFHQHQGSGSGAGDKSGPHEASEISVGPP
jgi:hypothetical protein